MKRYGDWARVAAITSSMTERFQRAVKASLMREAHYLRGEMVKGIASGAPAGQPFAPLAATTLAMRKAKGFGGTKPLIVTGTLRRSITVVQVRGGGPLGGTVFIGVHRSAKNTNGKSMVDLASIHEFGRSWTQNLSPRARRYLFAVLGKAGVGRGPSGRDTKGRFQRGKYQGGKGGTTISINIPARPFIRPIVRKFGKPEEVKKRFIANLLQMMGGDFKRLGGG